MSFDFDERYQKMLLAALLTDAETAFSYKFVIEPKHFQGECLSVICGALYDYIEKYHKLPRPSILADKLKREIKKYIEEDKTFAKQTLKVLKELYNTRISDLDYIKDLAAEFAEDAEWRSLYIDAPDLIESGDFDTLFDRTLVAREKGHVVYPYIVDRELDGRFKRLVKVVEGGLIKTGIKHFDEHFKIYPPFFGLITGDSGKGKTFMLVHLAKVAMWQGYDVLFFTGEMSSDDLAIRLDSSLVGVSTDFFYEPSLHKSLRERVKEKYKKLKGKLTIIRFIAGEYSVNELDADIRRFCMKEEQAPSLVLVDFLDLLTYQDSVRRRLQIYQEQVKISQYLQGVANANNIAMWAAGTLLTKRDQDDDALATRRGKSGAGDVIYAIDCFITLNQSQMDREKGQMLLLVDKFRKAEDQMVIGVIPDFSRSRFCTKSIGAIRRSTLEAKREKRKSKS